MRKVKPSPSNNRLYCPRALAFFQMRQSVLITQLNGVDQLTDFATKLRELGDVIFGREFAGDC